MKLPATLEMRLCCRCFTMYSPSVSGSALSLTYCGLFCEIGDLGFAMDAIEKAVFVKKAEKTVMPIEELLAEAVPA